MDNRPFKFRYANQLAGAFVLLALGLGLGSVFLTGLAKGWFEGKFVLRATFDTIEGTFGLQEGNEVLVRSAVAGRVGKVVPNDLGQMETTFVVRRSFQQFITRKSVARVKKKFGVAGDAFVEIQTAPGEPVQDGDSIVCAKDVELMDTAEKALQQVQEVIVPIMEEVKDILHHVNLITQGLQAGEGLAGAALKDKTMADDIKAAIGRMDAILGQAEQAVAEVTALVKDEALLKDVKGAVHKTDRLLGESQQAIRESTRLIMAIQKHWLFRKHVVPDRHPDPLSEIYVRSGEEEQETEGWRESLEEGRGRNDSALIALAGAHVAAGLIDAGDLDAAGPLIEEAKTEAALAGQGRMDVALAEAALWRARGDPVRALQAVTALMPGLRAEQRELRLCGQLLMADLYLDADSLDEASDTLTGAGLQVRKETPPVLSAMLAEVEGRLALREENPKAAAQHFDRQAAQLQAAEAPEAMARALNMAGEAHASAGDSDSAADRYFRAARSLLAGGRGDAARRLADKAREAADKAGNTYVLAQVRALELRLQQAETH